MNEARKEKLLNKMSDFKEQVKMMGGKEAVMNRLSLFEALVKYKTPEAGLKEFREKVTELGYHGLKKEMIEIVGNYGTAKDRSVLCLIGHFDMTRDGEKPLLTKKIIDEIRKDLYDEKETETLSLCTKLYSATQKIEDIVNLLRASYYTYGEKAAQYLTTYLWAKRTEDLLTELRIYEKKYLELLKMYEEAIGGKNEWTNEMREEIFCYPVCERISDLEKDIKETSQFGGEFVKTNYGSIQDEDLEKAWNYFVLACKVAEEKLSKLKGAIEGVTEWVKENDAEMLITTRLKRLILEIDYNATIDAIPDKYCYSHIRVKERKGIEQITDEERTMAIYPDYEGVEADGDMKDFVKKRLDKLRDGKY